MFELVLPATPDEWLAWAVPLATLLIGLGFFLLPKTLLGHFGMTGSVGEARSSFAGFLVGLAVSAPMFGQPVLYQQVGIAWAFAVIGKLVHLTLDGGRSISVITRLALAAVAAGLVFGRTDLPEIDFAALSWPSTTPQMLVAGAGAVAVAIGLLAFVVPGALCRLLGLAAKEEAVGAVGELRGTYAGFHLAAGLGVLAADGWATQFALAACWLLSAFGRMISMLTERDRLMFNWLLLIIEIGLGSAILAVFFGAVA
ncbi:MAG: DUF4345 family protein [Salaquimonas sp.]|nr:DUF4345 family protein [Salaquimonas sp.]